MSKVADVHQNYPNFDIEATTHRVADKSDTYTEEDNLVEEMKETSDQEPIEDINTDDPHPTKFLVI